MSVIKLKKARCKNCYKCIRVCNVKSILFKDEQAKIISDDCILCGKCLEACPQNAKQLDSMLDRVKDFFFHKETVVVSLAPSFIGSFDTKHPGQMVAALKKLGFAAVEETAVGAAYVTREYHKLIEDGSMDTVITTCCPTVNSLVEKYYPDLVGCLAPVLSPMVAHGKLIKQSYGDEKVRVVFIGPCISKMEESTDPRSGGYIDAVLNFEEVQQWLSDEHIVPSELEPEAFSRGNSGLSRIYPVTAGILKDLKKYGEQDKYTTISVDSIEECMLSLDAIREGQLKGYFIEMNACAGGCINGPLKNAAPFEKFQTKGSVTAYAKTNTDGEVLQLIDDFDISKQFMDRSDREKEPTEEEIRAILRKIGKETKMDELNCGACGYPTCRDKAIAVYKGKAELYMCLPYMHERAQSLANVILDNTPNVIIAVDEEYKIRELNSAFEKMFHTSKAEAVGRYLYEFIDTDDFEFVWQSHDNIYNKKVEYQNYDLVTEQTILFVPNQQLVMGIFRDITHEEKEAEQMNHLRLETIKMAQGVIDKQMVVAQEIASLLGETTAETKVTLTKLKDMVLFQEDDA